MSLNNINIKTETYLKNAYSALKNKGASLPKYKNLANLANCAYTVRSETVALPPEGEELEEIAVLTLPNKINYSEGESFDFTGLEIVAKYSNDVQEVITSGCVIEIADPLTVYTKEVIIKYGEYKTSFTINVYPKLLAIPDGTVGLFHFDGDAINTITGEVGLSSTPAFASMGRFGGKSTSSSFYIYNLCPTYSELVTGSAELTISSWNYTSYAGKRIITLRHTNYNNTCVAIWGNTETSLLIYSIGKNSEGQVTTLSTVVDVGENRMNKWNHYAITFANGYVNIFYNGRLIYTKELWGEGTMSMSINYGNSDTATLYTDEVLVSTKCLWESSFNVPVVEYGGGISLEKIYIKRMGKTAFQAGELFSLEGTSICAVYSDGHEEDIASECIIENADIPLTTADRQRIVSYTYNGITKKTCVSFLVYTIESELDLSQSKLLMNFDGNIQDLTKLNTPQVVGNDLYAPGKFGMARYFSGGTELIEFPITSELTIGTSDFTIALWVKFNDVTVNHTMVSCCYYVSSSIVYQGVNLWLNPNLGFCFSCDIDETNKIRIDSGVKPTTGIWYHVAAVRKDGMITLYIDGKKAGSIDANGAVYQNANTMWRIGSTNKRPTEYSNEFMNGYIDDLIITKSALWDTEFDPPSKSFSHIEEVE